LIQKCSLYKLVAALGAKLGTLVLLLGDKFGSELGTALMLGRELGTEQSLERCSHSENY
jgi:hypothetical protein